MIKVKRIGVLSLAVFFTVLYGGIGLLAGLLMSVMSLLGQSLSSLASSSAYGSRYSASSSTADLITGLGAVICFPLIYAVLGFIGGLITALIANLALKIMGGLELEVDSPGLLK